MRHQLTLQVRVTAQDSAGEPLLSWSDFATRRCAVEYAPGSELWVSAQRQARVPTVFRLRYLDGVTPSMRVVFNGKVFNVLSAVDQESRHEELVITAEELVGVTP
jgi:SPP1 family predicted phage head-tail adaptor